MRTQVQKWGNSLALRIPQAFAVEIGLKPESPVELSLANGRLVISPILEGTVTLEALLADVTPENSHAEVDFGKPMGKEVW